MCCGGVGRPALWGVGVGAGPLASIVVVGDGREAEKQAVLPRDPGY